MPTYNESATIAQIVSRVRVSTPHADVLIVDDTSPDGTGVIAQRLAAQDPAIRVLKRSGKLGLGTAYVAGFTVAIAEQYDIVVELDADGSHLPEQLPALLAAIHGSTDATGVDFALGSRWVDGGNIEGWPWYRQLISRTGTAVTRVLLGSRLRDATSGFRAIRVPTLASVPLAQMSSHGYGFQVELAWTLERFGATIAEVPITFVERAGGKSKMSSAIVCEALGAVVRWGVLSRLRPSSLPNPIIGSELARRTR